MGRDPDADTPALTPELLADLQAGLLDEATAARVRRRVRTDPDAARILTQRDTVRRELAVLGSDDRSAAAVPDDVTARVSAALRAAPGHAVARPRLTRGQRVALALGLTAAAAAVVAGVLVLSLREWVMRQSRAVGLKLTKTCGAASLSMKPSLQGRSPELCERLSAKDKQ